MAIVSMKALLEAGVHFGHRRRRWNPKMKSYIFTERNGIHIIDLQQTLSALETAYNLVRDTVTEGGLVLFVGTKRQAQESVTEQAERCSMPFVTRRWLGGTLTNFATIRKRIDYMIALEKRFEAGEIQRLPKKEVLRYQRELDRLHRRFGGLRNLTRVPDILFIVDIKREDIAVKEANIMKIPIVAMVDTNCDPDPIDYVIPANDDAIRAIRLMVTKMADAVLEGLDMRATLEAERAEELAARVEEEEAAPVAEFAGEYESEDELYLGEATLAKLRSGMFDEDEEPKAEKAEAAPVEESEPEIAEPEGGEEEVAEVPAEAAAEEMEPEAAPAVVEAVEAPMADAEPVELVEELPELAESAEKGDEEA